MPSKQPNHKGRYRLEQRVDPETLMAQHLSRNEWTHWKGLSWDDLEEANKLRRIFSGKHAYYQYRLVDSTNGTPVL